MPLIRLVIPPGLISDVTDYTAGPHWVSSDHVRFWQGMAEKIGGWEKHTTDDFDGVCRGMHIWASLQAVRHIALGTHTHLQVVIGGVVYDITPVRESGTLTDPFATTFASSMVVVTDASHGLRAGDRAIYEGTTAAGGLSFNGEWTVFDVLDTDTYRFIHTSVATSTATGGGTVTYTYLLTSGAIDSSLGEGWGVGPWGSGGWGSAYVPGLFLFPARTWSLDNWGEDLIANPRGGGIFVWDTSTGTSVRAVQIADAPDTNFIIVSPTDRHLVALGTDNDEMLVSWSDQEDYEEWTASATNTAGDFRLTEGTELISGLNTRGVTLLWSDTAMYSMQFIGPPYTFGFELMGLGCGIMSPHARAEVASRVFWWGRACRNFYVFDGAVRAIPCPILQTVANNFNFAQQDKVYAVPNARFNEVWFYYCSASSNDIDSYVIYNFIDNTWAMGTTTRTAGYDRGFYDNPIFAGIDEFLYEHDVGVNDDGAALASHLETGEFEAEPGDRLLLVDGLYVDANITGNLDFTIKTRKYPNGPETSKGPYALTSSTQRLSIRAKGRQFALRYSSDAIDDTWRLGTMRLDAQTSSAR